MKHPLAVFYHARLSGGRNYLNYSQPNAHNVIQPQFARGVFLEQMQALIDSKLYENANEIMIGVNASSDSPDAAFVEANYPPGANRKYWGGEAESLLPTMRLMHEWTKTHPNWNVLFLHTKGVNHAGEPFYNVWRWCSQKIVLWNWRQCAADLDAGYDAAGPHWLTREKYGPIVNPEHGGTGFFGGVIYWAKASYLAKLPPLIEKVTCTADWYWPEHFVGLGNPKVKAYADHWPGEQPCGATLR